MLGSISTTSHKEMHAHGTDHESMKMMTYSNKECIGTDGHENDVENPWFLVKGKGVNKKHRNTVM